MISGTRETFLKAMRGIAATVWVVPPGGMKIEAA